MVTGEAPAAATIVLGLQQQAAAAMPRASATRLRRSAAVTASSTARHAQQQAAPSLLKDCSADAVGTTSWGQQAALEFSAYECPHDCIESCRMLLMLGHNGIKFDIAMPRLQSRSSSSSMARPLAPCSRTSRGKTAQVGQRPCGTAASNSRHCKGPPRPQPHRRGIEIFCRSSAWEREGEEMDSVHGVSLTC